MLCLDAVSTFQGKGCHEFHREERDTEANNHSKINSKIINLIK